MRFSEISIRQAKSKIKAGEGLDCGSFKFFTSGVTQSKFLDTAQYQGPALIFGTGGSPSIHYCEEEFSTSTDCVVYYPTDDSVDFYCAYQFFKSHMYLLEKGFRGAGLKHIKKEYIENIEINWLNEEQRNVVTGVSKKIDNLIAKRKIQLDKLETLSSALFYEMFGDPVKNEKGWERKTLGSIGLCVSGGTPSRKNPAYFAGDINWYSAGELNTMYLSESAEKITEFALKNSAAKLCNANSLFIGMYDTAAFKLGICKTKSTSNQACANISLYNDNTIWLYFVLSTMRDEALKHRHGARQKNLNLKFIKNFIVPIPPLPLQQEFADKISRIEKQKELIRSSVEKLELLKNSLMQQYFA